VLSRRVAWSVALVATLTMAVSYVDRQAFATLSFAVKEDLGLSGSQYGWLQSAFSFAYLAATPLCGWWIDRVGARRGLVISVLLWSAVAGLHCFATGFAMLFALRIALGIAEGPSFPGSAQVIQRALPPAERARGFGVLFTGSSLGAMVVPPLAAALYVAYGWRFAFIGTALVGLIWLPLWLLATRQRGVREALDTPVDTGPPEPRSTFRDLARSPVTIRALLGILAAAPVAGFSNAWGTLFLQREFRISQGDVGVYLWLPPLAFDAGAILFGHLASRQHREDGEPPRLLYGISIPLAAGGLAALPNATTPWEGMALIGVAMVGAGGLYTLVTADFLSRVPQRSVSLASGMMAGAQSLALIIMNPLLGAAVDHYGSYDGVVQVIALWVLPGSLAWLLWKPAKRPSTYRFPEASIVKSSDGDSSKS
jgi:ACS family hexuronate transporter-like MFS transporter